MHAMQWLVAIILVCGIAAKSTLPNCGYLTPTGPVDLSSVPTTTLKINQLYQGIKTPYNYVVNLCEAVSRPPAGIPTPCKTDGFISQFSNFTCEREFSSQNRGWEYDQKMAVGSATYENFKGWHLNIKLVCGQTLELKALSEVIVSKKLDFSLFLSTSAACPKRPVTPTCGYLTPNGPVDLSSVPTTTLKINQLYQGIKTPYNYVVNLCDAVSRPPAGIATPCKTSGFISQFSSITCETNWPSQSRGWLFDQSMGVGSAVFESTKGWHLNVKLVCGQKLELTPTSDMVVTDNLQFTVFLSTSAACH